MKTVGIIFVLLICAVLLVSGNTVTSVKAADMEAMPCYSETNDIETYLNFSQNLAMCDVIIQGKSGTSKITGTITLYDETAGKNVAVRTVYEESTIYTGSFSVDVAAGHKYTLSYLGYVIEENIASQVSVTSKEERDKLLMAAAAGTLVENDINIFVSSTTSDTITEDGYNLSTICPSVWTVAMGKDRFARPSTAMDKDEIQAFLESKNSVLADDILIYRKDANGNVYNTNISINPATDIDEASREHIINPKIILGSLQREQGLITKTSGDVSTRSFYFCMGYGATDLWNEAYNSGTNAMPRSFEATDGTVTVNNCGTYALYRYTPWKSSNLLSLQILKGYWPSSSGVNGINWE